MPRPYVPVGLLAALVVCAFGCGRRAERAAGAATPATTEPVAAEVPITAERASGSAGSAPATAAGPSATADALLEAAQYALVAHPLRLEDPDVGALVSARCTLIAIDLAVSAELRAAGRLRDAWRVREEAHARTLQVSHLEPLLGDNPTLGRVIEVDPDTLHGEFAGERARAAGHVAELAERAFRDESRVSAPTIEATVAAVEAYVSPIGDEGGPGEE